MHKKNYITSALSPFYRWLRTDDPNSAKAKYRALLAAVVTVFLMLALAGCSNSPERPETWTTPEGDSWVMTFISSAVSGSTHLYIDGKLVASGSFGLLAGNSASGSGAYRGKKIFFTCTHRYTPDCRVFIEGREVALLQFRYAPPAVVKTAPAATP